MKTRKQIEHALSTAERRVDDAYDKLSDALSEYAFLRVVNGGVNFVPLSMTDNDDEPLKLSTGVEAAITRGEVIYGWAEDVSGKTHRARATKREVNRLLRLESRLNDWNAKRYWLECLLDDIYEDDTFFDGDSFKECVRELAALGYSIE